LGLASVLGGLALTGVPALLLGLRAVRAAHAGDGRWRGARLAAAGMALGGLGSVVLLVGLFALLAVRLRLRSHRVESANNLRQIGAALNKYADVRGTFPPATRDPARLPPGQRLSWMAEVMPLLAEGSPRHAFYEGVARKIDPTQGWAAPANAAALNTPLRVFLCRGDPDYDPAHRPALTNYVGLAGINPGAADLPRDDPRAGMFGNGRGVRRREVTRGVGYTLMVLETGWEKGPWLAGGRPTVRGLDPGVTFYGGPGRPFGGVEAGVTNVLYVDGAVRVLSDETPGALFRAQATLRGGGE
jgi:hypothetical protein